VAIPLDLARAAACQHNRQIVVRMQIPITDAAPIKDQGMIEEIAVAIRRGTQPLKIIGQHLGVEDIDLGCFLDLFGIALVVAGATALNQVLERHSDAQMERTRNRPLPARRLRRRRMR